MGREILCRKDICKSAAAFNLLEVEILMLMKYQRYSILSDLSAVNCFCHEINSKFSILPAKGQITAELCCPLRTWEGKA